jgi:hypothetical protein
LESSPVRRSIPQQCGTAGITTSELDHIAVRVVQRAKSARPNIDGFSPRDVDKVNDKPFTGLRGLACDPTRRSGQVVLVGNADGFSAGAAASGRVVQQSDRSTVCTADGGLSAHYEHTGSLSILSTTAGAGFCVQKG